MGREELRPVLQRVQLDRADDPVTVGVGAHEIGGGELGLAEELVAAEVLEPDQVAQDDARGGAGQAAELGQLALALVAGEVADDRAQVLEVEQRQAGLVGEVEDQTQ